MYLLTELLRRQDNVFQHFTLKHGACIVSLRTIESDGHVLLGVKEHIRGVLFDVFLRLLEELTAEMRPLIHLQQRATRELEGGAGDQAINGRARLVVVEAMLHTLSQKTEALHTMGELARDFAAREMNCGEEGRRSPMLTSFLETLDALILAMNLHSLALLDVVQALEKSLGGTCQ